MGGFFSLEAVDSELLRPRGDLSLKGVRGPSVEYNGTAPTGFAPLLNVAPLLNGRERTSRTNGQPPVRHHIKYLPPAGGAATSSFVRGEDSSGDEDESSTTSTLRWCCFSTL